MANANGGFLIFGVVDRALQVANIDDRIVGIPLGSDLHKEFGEKLKSLEPEVHFESSPQAIELPQDRKRGVFVVRIPISPLRPHMITGEGVFYRRAAGGFTESMGVYEVRDLMLLTQERLRKATLLRLELGQYREQIKIMKDMDTAVTTAFCVLTPAHSRS